MMTTMTMTISTMVVVILLLFVASILLILRAVKSPEVSIIPTTDFVWAHRGKTARSMHNENTTLACIETLQAGYSGIEIDVHAHEGEFYVHHHTKPRGQKLDAFMPHILRHGAWLLLDMKRLPLGAEGEAAARRLRKMVDVRRTVFEVYEADAVSMLNRHGLMTAITPRRRGNARPTFLIENASLILWPLTIGNTYTPPGGWIFYNLDSRSKGILALLKRLGVVAVVVD